MTKIAVLQMCAGIDPDRNAATLENAIAQASAGGAAMLFTPEMSGMIDKDRARSGPKLRSEDDDVVLARVRDAAKAHGIWVAIGSLGIKRADGALVNRSYLIDNAGAIKARYDKIHMFDVVLATGETWRESATYTPGEEVVTAGTPAGKIGFAVCYDVRFPALFERLGHEGVEVISIPAAFTVPTGQAHWYLLQRARAVEQTAYVIAAAQVGEHEDGRRTYGHSLVIDPWGEVLLDLGGAGPALGFAEIDLTRLADIRQQLPSLANRRNIPKANAS